MKPKTFVVGTLFFLLAVLFIGAGCTKGFGPVSPNLPSPTPTATFTYTATPQRTATPCSTGIAFGGGTGEYGSPALTVNGTYFEQFIANQSFQLFSMSALMATNDPSVTFGIYSDSANSPQNLIWASQPTTPIVNTGGLGYEAWTDVVLNLPAGTYWLALSSPDPMELFYGSGSAPGQFTSTNSMPNPFSGGAVISGATQPVEFWTNGHWCQNYPDPVPTYTPVP